MGRACSVPYKNRGSAIDDGYLDGEIDSITYSLDFPYEVEKRYKKMLKEDKNYAEMIYDYLVEEGVNLYDGLSKSEFKKLIEKQYKYLKDTRMYPW